MIFYLATSISEPLKPFERIEMETNSTALSVLDRIEDPQMFIVKMGMSFAESQMFGCKTPAQGIVLAMHCAMERVSPLSIMQQYHMIEGKLSMKTDEMLRRFSRRGGKWTWISDGRDGKAVIELERDGRKQTVTYSLDDAKSAGLLDSKNPNWKLRPANMLRSRAVSDGLRMFDPESTGGCYTEDELQDVGIVEATVVTAHPTGTSDAPTSAPALTAAAEPTKRTRKPKETTEAPAESPAPTPPQTAAESIAEAVKTVEPAVVDVASEPVKPVEEPANTPTAPVLPQVVADIIALRDKTATRWNPQHKSGPWEQLWPKVLASLAIKGDNEIQALCKAPDNATNRLLTWLVDQNQKLDAIAGVKTVDQWANQTPQTSANTAG